MLCNTLSMARMKLTVGLLPARLLLQRCFYLYFITTHSVPTRCVIAVGYTVLAVKGLVKHWCSCYLQTGCLTWKGGGLLGSLISTAWYTSLRATYMCQLSRIHTTYLTELRAETWCVSELLYNLDRNPLCLLHQQLPVSLY